MNQKKELMKNTLIISIGKFSTQLVSFLLLPLYTSLLTTTEYGRYDLLNTISIFLIPCITLLMEEGMFRFLIDAKDDKEKGEVFSITTTTTTISFLVWSILILIVGSIIKYPYTIYLIFYLLASILSSLAGSSARGLGKFKIYSLFCFLSSFFNIILNILFIAILKVGITGLFISYIVANSLVSLWLLYKIDYFKLIKFKGINKKKTKEMIKYSFPLVPNSISWNAISLTDRLLITNILNDGMNGIYSVANRFPTIIKTKKLGIKYLSLSNLIYFFNLLIKNAYREAYNYIPIMVMNVYFSNLSNFSSGIFSAYKDTKILATTTIVAALINFLIGFILIKKIGLYATILATLISYIVIFIYRNYKLKKYIKLDRDKYLIPSFLVLIIVSVSYYLRNYLICFLTLVIAFIYSYYLNKSLINTIVLKFKRKR